jgi:hypothetical protein
VSSMPPIAPPTAAPMTVSFRIKDVGAAVVEDVADGGDAGEGKLEAIPLLEAFNRANNSLAGT